jgi:hypothetical protein
LFTGISLLNIEETKFYPIKIFKYLPATELRRRRDGPPLTSHPLTSHPCTNVRIFFRPIERIFYCCQNLLANHGEDKIEKASSFSAKDAFAIRIRGDPWSFGLWSSSFFFCLLCRAVFIFLSVFVFLPSWSSFNSFFVVFLFFLILPLSFFALFAFLSLSRFCLLFLFVFGMLLGVGREVGKDEIEEWVGGREREGKRAR